MFRKWSQSRGLELYFHSFGVELGIGDEYVLVWYFREPEMKSGIEVG